GGPVSHCLLAAGFWLSPSLGILSYGSGDLSARRGVDDEAPPLFLHPLTRSPICLFPLLLSFPPFAYALHGPCTLPASPPAALAVARAFPGHLRGVHPQPSRLAGEGALRRIRLTICSCGFSAPGSGREVRGPGRTAPGLFFSGSLAPALHRA